MRRPVRCLLVFPEFKSRSFWNYQATCSLVGAKYPAAPLGIITVAALLPSEWELTLIDCNVEELEDEAIAKADIVFTGGMIAQQVSTLQLIDRLKDLGKTVVVGGPDATSSPHLYDRADYLVLGEAEITLPRWLEAFEQDRAESIYACAEGELADVTSSPIPRYDLLQFDQYLHVGVQFARGCPFRCEFCDIIELFGRVPRLKTPEQMFAELDRLYELGYRGHIDFVDDNFIGNKRDVKKFLPRLADWLEDHSWPYEFSTEASINIADDDALLTMMQDVGFSAIFVGIESPDEETLKAAQKGQNTKRSLAESVRKIYSYGIFVNAGYIIGFDSETKSVATPVLNLIEETAVPVNMVGLLFALPNTQLSRRLAREGRLADSYERVPQHIGDQCTSGLNFQTKRPLIDILRDYKHIIAESYSPEAYFRRVLDVGTHLDCGKKRLRMPLSHTLRDLRGFVRLLWRMGVRASYRRPFWSTLLRLGLRNPRSLRYSVAMIALYLHFGQFRFYVLGRLDEIIANTEAMAATEIPPSLAERTKVPDKVSWIH